MKKFIISILILCMVCITGCGKKTINKIEEDKEDDILIPEEIVIDKIDKSRKIAAETSACNLITTAKFYSLSKLLDSPSSEETKIVFSQDENGEGIYSANDGKISMNKLIEDGFDIDGDIPTEGFITIDLDGNVNGNVKINKFMCEISNSKLVSCE